MNLAQTPKLLMCLPASDVLICMYVTVDTHMRFLWDENKSRMNVAKHKVSFEVASLVFEDPHSISQFDRIKDGEERCQTLGCGRHCPPPDRSCRLPRSPR